MSQDLSLISTSGGVSSFVKQMAALRGTSSGTPSPKMLRLDGNTGEFVLKSWNNETKQSEDKPFATPFQGTVILYKYFVQWKYKTTPEGIKIMSREFTSFKDEKLELLKIDYNQQSKTEVIGTYENYGAFKEAVKTVDPITGKESFPFDFWVTLYVYAHELGEVVRFKFKGTTRAAWFDYNNGYRLDMADIEDICQVTTEFGTKKEDKPKSSTQEEADTYFSGTFTTSRVNTEVEMIEIMKSAKYLASWMASFNKEATHSDQEEYIPVGSTEVAPVSEIDLSQVPF